MRNKRKLNGETLKTGRFVVETNRSFRELREYYLNDSDSERSDVKVIEEIYNPLKVRHSQCLIASDWHGERYDRSLKKVLFKVADEYSVDALLVPGDFWDCDAYTSFTRFNHELTFRHEVRLIRELLKELTERFKYLYFCRGNHEHRWLKANLGMMCMEDLFYVTGITKGYKVTLDDHIFLSSNGENWRVCHPPEFSKTIFKIPKALAEKYKMHIFYAHGHRLGWCMDESGTYQCVEGGGLFDKKRIEYLRNTTRYAEVASGFWLIQDGWANVFPGKNKI